MEPLWQIRVLGELTAWRHDQTIQRFKAGKASSLLGYLVYFAGQDHAREQLMERFWPDADVEAARHCLRQALFSLRRQFEPPGIPVGTVLIASRQSIKLRVDSTWTDVAAMRQYIHQAEAAAVREERIRCHIQAAEAYQGELLPGLYDDWVLIERERLGNAHARVLDALAADLEILGEHERALDYALRLITALPFDEDAYGRVMRLYARLGRSAEALRHYRKLESRLRRELGTEPCSDLQAFVRTLAPSEGQAPRSAPARVVSITPISAPADGGLSTGSISGTDAARLPAGSLPIKLTRFVGREEELARLVERLRARASAPQEVPIPRLVTLTGLGGAGKTRLAMEAARILAGEYDSALYFVSLAEVTSGSGLSAALLDRLQSPRSPAAAPIRQILDGLSRQPTLLVLDSFEHLLPDGAAFVHMLCQQVPTLTCLITSRQLLGLDGEQEIPVHPLPVPQGSVQPSDVLTFASVQLFVDRARAAASEFEVTPENASAVAALCVCLEGLPLAIELAAAHVRTLTPAQIHAQLADRFGFLVARHSGREFRQRTLRATLDWSYQPLPAPLKRLLGQLSVFRGGWTLAAAQSICAAPDALSFLEQLRERSLITVQESGGEMRYRMLDMVREYAAERLERAEAQRLSADHAAYFTEFAERAEGPLRGRERAVWLEYLEREHDNIRAVAANPTVQPATLLRIGGALWRFWLARGYLHEGRGWLQHALASDDGVLHTLRARALQGAGVLARHQGDYRHAKLCLEESLTLFQDRSNEAGMAEVLNHLSVLANEQGEYQAARLYQERSLPLWEAHQDLPGLAATYNGLGQTAHNLGDFAAAGSHYAESARIYRQLGDTAHQAIVLSNQAAIAFECREYAGARLLYTECFALFEAQGNRLAVAVTLHNLGETCLRQGELEEARRCLSESVRLRDILGNTAGLVRSLATLGCVEQARGAWDRAVRLLAAAEALRVQTATVLPIRERTAYEAERSHLESLLIPATFRAAWTAGTAMPLEQTIRFALAADPPSRETT